nr:putative salivary protein [Nilaparvata lugens]
MGGVWRYVLFTLLLTTVVGALLKKSKSSKPSSKTDTSQQADPVVEIIIVEKLTLAEGEYMTKRTGKSGDSLIIGSYSPPLDDDYLTTSHYVCELANENGLYNEKIEPEIYKRTSDSYEMTGAEEKQEQDLSENFIRIKMEIWKCRTAKIRRTHDFFYFIRNEFISFKEIRDIKYVAGVEVSLIDYSSDERRVKVVETKYYYRKDHTVHSDVHVKASALNFELQLQVRDRQTTYPRPGFAFEVKSPDVSRRKSDVSRRKSDVSRRESDVSRRESDVSRQSVRSQESSGFLFLRLGPSATPNTDIITAECEPIQGMNPALRRPEVFKVFNSSKQGSAPNEDQNIYARLSDKEFDDHFIITKRKFWKCRPTPTTTTTTSKSTSKGKVRLKQLPLIRFFNRLINQ